MATGVSNFSITNSGDNVNFSVTWEGFTCAVSPVVRIRLIDNATGVSVATLEYSSGIGTTGTITGTFTNIYDGVFYASALFLCDGLLVSIYNSAALVHGSSVPAPSAPPAPPGTGPTGVGSNNINANSNLNFCIGTAETDVSFSRLNQIFGRRAGNTPNTELSGPLNPSMPPSLFGFSYLSLTTVTPGKLRQNAVSELRGTCNYAAPNLYKVTLQVEAAYMSGFHIIVPYKVVWVHEASGNVVEECPFDSSRVEVFLSVRVNSTYVGAAVPTPYRARVTKFTFATSGVANQDTSRTANNTVGTTSHSRQIVLAYRDRVYGFLEGENAITQPTSTFKITLTVDVANTTYHQLASINIPRISNARPLVIERIIAASGTFTYSFFNSLSGSGATSSILAVASVFSNTRSTTGTNEGAATSSSLSGNRTVSITPSPTSLYTTLRVQENGIDLFNNTALGTQSLTVNFLAGATYILTGLSTTAVQ